MEILASLPSLSSDHFWLLAAFAGIEHTQLPVVEYAIQQRPNLLPQIYQGALHRRNLPAIQYLIEEADRRQVQINLRTPLQIAAKAGDLPMVQFLVQHGATEQDPNHFALQEALQQKNWNVFYYLATHGEEPREHNYITAIEDGAPSEIIQLYLQTHPPIV
jgi:hypothetical protein